MDTNCLNHMLTYKHDALQALLQLLAEHRLSSIAELGTNASGERISVIKILGDYFDDGDPVEITNSGDAEEIDTDTIYAKEFNTNN